jgi:hypothetical protein
MIVLGNSESPNITIIPIQPSSTKDWLQADVCIKLDCFSGKINVYFEKYDLEKFQSELKTLYKTLKGKAELIPREEQFTLILSCDEKGHVSVKGEAFERATYGSCLNFDFELDQTYLPELIESLNSVLS